MNGKGAGVDVLVATSNLERAQQEQLQKQLSLRGLRERLAGAKDKEKELKSACQGFESIFINKLWKQMRSTVPKGFLHSKEEDFYLSMFDQELAKKLSEDGGIGLGDEMYKQLREQLARSSSKTIPRGERTPIPLRRAVNPLRVAPLYEEQEPQAAKPAAFDGSSGNMYSPLDEGMNPVRTNSAPTTPAGDVSGHYSQPGQPGNVPPQDEATADFLNRARLSGRLTDQSKLRMPPVIPAQGASASESNFQLQAPSAQPVSAVEVRGRVEELANSIVRQQGPVDGRGGPAPVPSAYPSVGVGQRLREAVEVGGARHNVPLHWPVQGGISSAFGWRKDPFTGEQAFHAGVDIRANEGSTVQACWDGVVVHAGPKGGYGNLVILEHEGGWKSYYGHNSEVDVEMGDKIQAGRKIAELGSSGRSTGAHLHFELRQGDQAWDPTMIQNRLLTGLPIGRVNFRG